MIQSGPRLCARLLAGAWLASAALAPALPAAAAEIRVVRTPSGDAILELGGIIDPGDDARVTAAVARGPRPDAVSLSSLGGNVEAALAIGTLVRREGMRTLVPACSICASACGLVWLAGTPRAMGAEAHVGLHAAYLRRDGVSVETGAANALVGAYLDRLGFDDRAIVYLTGAAPDEMTWILAADRQRYGIAFEAAGSPTPATADGAAGGHLLARPMALADAIASAAVGVIDRLLGRASPPAAGDHG